MTRTTDREITVSAVSPGQWLIIAISVLVAGLGIWQSILPYIAERHYRDGFNFDAMSRFKYAAEELELAVKYAPWETQYLMQLGKEYEGLAEQSPDVPTKLRWLEQAMTTYRRCVELDEKNPWEYNRIAAVYGAMADVVPSQRDVYIKKSEENVRLAAAYDHENPLFQLNLAYFLHRMGRFAEAKTHYLRVIGMDPNVFEAHFNLADIYRREGRLDKTLSEYQAIYAVNKDFANINVAISGTLIQMNRIAESAPYLEDEIKKRPDFADGIKSLISVYSNLGNQARVAELYYQLIMLNPGSKEFYPGFAAAVRASGKRDQTIAALEQFKTQNPGATILDELIALIR
ncbi:hypothetical protein EB093_04505 [bacterium]|nr:hypothetical protein [bacterium]